MGKQGPKSPRKWPINQVFEIGTSNCMVSSSDKFDER